VLLAALSMFAFFAFLFYCSTRVFFCVCQYILCHFCYYLMLVCLDCTYYARNVYFVCIVCGHWGPLSPDHLCGSHDYQIQMSIDAAFLSSSSVVWFGADVRVCLCVNSSSSHLVAVEH
jgi:hypothetical protein